MVKIIDFNNPVNQIRPQLYKYLSSISSKIDGRSYQRFKSSFSHGSKALMKKTYDDLHEIVSKPNLPKKVSMKQLTELNVMKQKEIVKRKTNNAVNKIQAAFHNTIRTETGVVSTAFKKYTMKVITKAVHVGRDVGDKNPNRTEPQRDGEYEETIIRKLKMVVTKMFYESMSKANPELQYKIITYIRLKRTDENKSFDVNCGK